jgi:hypothetical protein
LLERRRGRGEGWGGQFEKGERERDEAGNTDLGGRLSTVDLLIRVACFVKKGK